MSRIKEKESVENIKEHFVYYLTSHMNTWKCRMPHKYEDLTLWKLIIDQRNFIYSLVKKRLFKILNVSNALPPAGMDANGQPIPPNAHPSHDIQKKLNYFSDMIWNNLKYAAVERGFDYYGTLRTLPSAETATSPGEAYMNYKEQILYRLNCNVDYENALKIANNAIGNEMLNNEHKSEMHRLKVMLFQALGKTEEANQECIEGMKTWDANFKCWKTWSVMCYKAFMASKQMKWGEQMIICFLHGVKYKPYKSQMLMGTVFFLLNSDDKSKLILRAFERCVEETPTWVWLVWVPQLISGIIKGRPEATCCYQALKRIAVTYPQALYYILRRFKNGNASVSSTQLMDSTSNYFNEVFAPMRLTDPVMYEALDGLSNFLSEYSVRQEENVINELHNLITTLYSIHTSSQMDKFRLKIFLNLQSSINTLVTNPQDRINLHEIMRVQDANPQQMLAILNKFIAVLKDNIEANRTPLRIESDKHSHIQTLVHTILEIPGQYNTKKEPNTKKHIRINAVGRDIITVEKGKHIFKRMSFLGSNEKHYHYFIQKVFSNEQNLSESFSTLLVNELKQLLNIKLTTERESMQRGLEFRSQDDYFLNSQVWLIKADQNLENLSDVLNEFMDEKGVQHEYALELDLKDNFIGNPDWNNCRKKIYQKMNALVPQNLLQKKIEKLATNLDHYYEMRKTFTYSFAMESFFCYVISSDFGLENMFFNKQKATFRYYNMKPLLSQDSTLQFKRNNYNSLRLSKNIQVAFIDTIQYFNSNFLSTEIYDRHRH